MQVLFISVCSNKSAVIISGNQQREKAEDSKKQKKGKDFLVFFLVFFSIFLFLFFFLVSYDHRDRFISALVTSAQSRIN